MLAKFHTTVGKCREVLTQGTTPICADLYVKKLDFTSLIGTNRFLIQPLTVYFHMILGDNLYSRRYREKGYGLSEILRV